MKLYAYKQGSESAKELATALDIKRLRHEGPPIEVDVLINWGASQIKREVYCPNILNEPGAVTLATNKLRTFQVLDGRVSIPQWTADREEALEWLIKGADTVVIRNKLTGHSGEGIVLFDNAQRFNDAFPVAPLYTKYIDKSQEYRVHVFRGEAFFIQRKARKLDVPDDEVNWKVRNLKGGFIYANKEVLIDDEGKEQAIKAVGTLGLDFGAVDLVLGRDGRYYVLEVNTACGLAGTTLDKYVEQFRKVM